MPTYVFITTPQRVFGVERILQENGHDAFVPVEWRWRRLRHRTRNREQVPVPKLGPYGFLTCDGPAPVFDEFFRQRFSFRYLRGEDGLPASLPDWAVEKVKAMTEQPRKIKRYNTHGSFRVNEVVKILEGPFEGETVSIHDIRGKYAVILRQLFGAEREVLISFEELEKAA